ncbi:polyprenol reductase-like [Ornithodoros turicata]|uniref:polyprenol reductase-like n=1 Tax=Ornithodoros turicata TaxID=34597 RepID=UPI0031389616
MIWNPLDVFWIIVATTITVVSSLYVWKKESVPELLTAAMLYGKMAKTEKKSLRLKDISIPKRWFAHFYQFGVVIFAFCTFVMLQMFVFKQQPPSIVRHVLDIAVPNRSVVSVSASTILIVQILESLQVFRRCYECMFVSVYSDAQMHIWHYLMGYLFYFGVQLSILSNAPGFASSSATIPSLSLYDLSWNHVVGTVLFLWAYKVQFDSHLRMASLRKDSTGKVITTSHKIPHGGWFELVSCPHYFAEIMVYSALTLILWRANLTWWLMMYWTWSNQIAVSFLSHYWYRENFREYPKHRKAVFPFVL